MFWWFEWDCVWRSWRFLLLNIYTSILYYNILLNIKFNFILLFMFQEQSCGRSVKQTFANKRYLSRSDFSADRGPIVTWSATGRAADNQQQHDEKRAESSQNTRHHYVGVSGLLASLFPLVMYIQYHFLNFIAKYLSFSLSLLLL